MRSQALISIADGQNARVIRYAGEIGNLRACQKALRTKIKQRLEKNATTIGVEMRANFVKEDNRRGTVLSPYRFGGSE
jgi:hypothetical protein